MRWLIVGAALITLVGCKQGAGDRCQVQSDCDDGLLCVLPNGGDRQTGGTCQPMGGFDGSLAFDLATPSTDMAHEGD
jgi:hypothetical protein